MAFIVKLTTNTALSWKEAICHSLHDKRCLTSCTLLTRQSASVLKVGVAKLIKEDWPIMLQ